jgi:hypothetical protein
MTADIQRAARAIRELKEWPYFAYTPAIEAKSVAYATATISAVFLEPSDEVVEAAAEAYWDQGDSDDAPTWARLVPFLKQSVRDGVRAALRVAAMKVLEQ